MIVAVTTSVFCRNKKAKKSVAKRGSVRSGAHVGVHNTWVLKLNTDTHRRVRQIWWPWSCGDGEYHRIRTVWSQQLVTGSLLFRGMKNGGGEYSNSELDKGKHFFLQISVQILAVPSSARYLSHMRRKKKE